MSSNQYSTQDRKAQNSKHHPHSRPSHCHISSQTTLCYREQTLDRCSDDAVHDSLGIQAASGGGSDPAEQEPGGFGKNGH